MRGVICFIINIRNVSTVRNTDDLLNSNCVCAVLLTILQAGDTWFFLSIQELQKLFCLEDVSETLPRLLYEPLNDKPIFQKVNRFLDSIQNFAIQSLARS